MCVVVCDLIDGGCVRLWCGEVCATTFPRTRSGITPACLLPRPVRGHPKPSTTRPSHAHTTRASIGRPHLALIFGRAGASNAAQPPTLTTNRIPNPLAPLYDIHVVCYRRGGNQPPHTTTHPYILDRAAWLPPHSDSRARSSCGGVVVTSVAAVRARWRSQQVRVGKKKGWCAVG